MKGNRSSWEITSDDKGTITLAFKPHQSWGWRTTTKAPHENSWVVSKGREEVYIASTITLSFRGVVLAFKTFQQL